MSIGPRKPLYADIHVHDNVTETVMNNADSPHLIQGLFALEKTMGFTFAVGSTGSITNTENNGGILRITAVDHGLLTGAIVTTTGLTTEAQNNITKITVINSSTFDCDDISFVTASETGIWYQGDRLIANINATGTYTIDFHSYGSSVAVNKIFQFFIYINEIEKTVVHCKRKYSTLDIGSIGATGIVEIIYGDEITFALSGQDTTNFIMEHTNIVINRIH